MVHGSNKKKIEKSKSETSRAVVVVSGDLYLYNGQENVSHGRGLFGSAALLYFRLQRSYMIPDW